MRWIQRIRSILLPMAGCGSILLSAVAGLAAEPPRPASGGLSDEVSPGNSPDGSCEDRGGAGSMRPLPPRPGASAQTLDEEAFEAWRRGDAAGAASLWRLAADRYRQSGQPTPGAAALVRAAEARGALGYERDSRALLEQALATATGTADPELAGRILCALARSDIRVRDFGSAERRLEEAASKAREAQSKSLEAAVAYGRGDLGQALERPAAAAEAYARSEELARASGDTRLAAQAAARAARAQLDAEDGRAARASLARAAKTVATLPDSDGRAQLWIHLARSRERLAEASELSPAEQRVERKQAASEYAKAIAAAERLGSLRTESYALGRLGGMHERAGRREDALSLTRRAVAAAQRSQADEALVLWHWQIGRLMRAEGDPKAAIDAYRRSVKALNALRATSGVSGLAFAREVEPVYYGLVDLLIAQAGNGSSPTRRQALLGEARDRLEELKSAELRDYFQDACLAPLRETRADTVAGAVIVYPVVLPDRTELIVSRAGQLRNVSVPVPSEQLVAEAMVFQKLVQNRTTRRYRIAAAQLYDRLVRPIEGEIDPEAGETLVFVPDRTLRGIPLAALYDRQDKEFLIEKIALAVVPALELTEPRSIDRGNVRTLLAGLTLARQGFPPLASVASELDAVGNVFDHTRLVDETFRAATVESALAESPFGIVHIATHAQFAGDSAQSFLLTYDGRLGIDQLSRMVERTRFRDEPIELLTLSACETAAGDDRAALGLAGIAIRSGARSALATLWTVNDDAAAELVGEFYRQLAEPGVSKAEALRRAQRSLIENRTTRHPGLWSPFLLISNWM